VCRSAEGQNPQLLKNVVATKILSVRYTDAPLLLLDKRAPGEKGILKNAIWTCEKEDQSFRFRDWSVNPSQLSFVWVFQRVFSGAPYITGIGIFKVQEDGSLLAVVTNEETLTWPNKGFPGGNE